MVDNNELKKLITALENVSNSLGAFEDWIKDSTKEIKELKETIETLTAKIGE